MTEVEITERADSVSGIEGMTVNERLFVTGLMDELDLAIEENKAKARMILEALKVDGPSIDKIIKKTSLKLVFFIGTMLCRQAIQCRRS